MLLLIIKHLYDILQVLKFLHILFHFIYSISLQIEEFLSFEGIWGLRDYTMARSHNRW